MLNRCESAISDMKRATVGCFLLWQAALASVLDKIKILPGIIAREDHSIKQKTICAVIKWLRYIAANDYIIHS